MRGLYRWHFELLDAHHHIFLDLSDSSDATGLEELDRIFKNMRHARALMKEVNAMEKEMRYLISQLRDGNYLWENSLHRFIIVVSSVLICIARSCRFYLLFVLFTFAGIRGVKREVTYACHISSHPRCLNFLQRSTIEFIDAASCLHIDQVSGVTLKKYIENIFLKCLDFLFVISYPIRTST